MKKNICAIPLGALMILALVTGCQSYDSQVRELKTAYIAGDLQAATNLVVAEESDAHKSRDELIWHLEAASVLRTAGAMKESQASLAAADVLYEANLEKARISLSGEGLALFTNPATLPYRGQFYEGIMVSVYQTLNFLQVGDVEGARAAVMRGYERQQDAVAFNAERIEALQKAEEKEKHKGDIEKSRQNPDFVACENRMLADLPDTTGYADYVNPFAVYMDGLFHLYQGVDVSDKERARVSLARAASFASNHAAILRDLDAVSSPSGAAALAESCVYVIFETGMAASRKQIQLNFPIFISSTVSLASMAFPVLELSEDYAPALDVVAVGDLGVTATRTEKLCSMDCIIAQEYKDNMPAMMTRAIASAIVKAATAMAMNRVAQQQGAAAYAVTLFATTVYQVATNIADTRGWVTLPKEFQVCRLAMPESRKLRLATPNGTPVDVDVISGHVVGIDVRSASSTAPLVIQQFVLKQ